MKLITGLTIIACTAAFIIANRLDITIPGSKKPELERKSVAHYCAGAIPDIWSSAKDSGADFRGIPQSLVFATFDHVATNFCVCTQTKFGPGHPAREQEIFGKLAGLYLKMQFTRNLGKEHRQAIEREARAIATANRALIKRQPAWLKESNDVFRTCKKEQKIRGSLQSHVSGSIQ